MDVPCPKCNNTDLQKVSLASEEVLCQCDKRAQFHSALVGSGGSCRGLDSEENKANNAHRNKAVGWGHVESAGILQRICCPSKHSSFRSPSRRPLPKVCWPHASKIVRRVELFGPNHEIE
jgi:hypothetical protein